MACKITRFSDPVLMTDTQREYWNVHNNLKYQAAFVDRMIDHLRSERVRAGYDLHWSYPYPALCPVVGPVVDAPVVLRRRSLVGPPRFWYRDWERVESLEKDLVTWKSQFDDVNSRFADLRKTMDKCDSNMNQLKSEVKKYSSTVDDILAKTKDVERQYNLLSDNFNFRKVRWADWDFYRHYALL